MKFKLDENFGPNIEAVFVNAGHDCETVHGEKLVGAADEVVLAAATAEGRILVTQDFDFSNVVAYPPALTAGIAIVSPHGRASKALLQRMVESLMSALANGQIDGKLWIVEPGRIRIHDSSDE